MQGEERKQGGQRGADQPAGQLPLTSSGAFGPAMGGGSGSGGVLSGPSPFPLSIKLEWDGAVSLLVLREMTHAALLSEIAQTIGDEAAQLAQRRGRLSYVDGQHCSEAAATGRDRGKFQARRQQSEAVRDGWR